MVSYLTYHSVYFCLYRAKSLLLLLEFRLKTGISLRVVRNVNSYMGCGGILCALAQGIAERSRT